jgi:cell fate (sporulation/competence/biofilm development) regulator YlbF (YheA/YmcA/DUF963 family)
MALPVKQEVAVDKSGMVSVQNNISITLLEATSTLGENLVQSEPFLRFHEADRKLQKDQEAMRLLTEFSDLQQKIRDQQHSGAFSESDIKQLRKVQSVISTNDVIQEHGLARETAIAFLREVNQEISSLIGVDFASLTRRAGGCCCNKYLKES